MIPRILTRLNESVFEALVPAGEGYRRIVFPASSVAQAEEGAGKTTLLRLLTGTTIPVALPYKTVKDYLYGDNMKTRQPFYDLTAVTGPAILPPAPFTPGEQIVGKGIFVGQYAPRDRDGKSLARTFNVFAAPEDLPGKMKYVDVDIARLKNWHGHDGAGYTTDKGLYAALKDGSYNGGWFIPTRDILHGQDVDGKKTTPDNIFAHRNMDAFKDTFKSSIFGHWFGHWYWSSTELRNDSDLVYAVSFTGGSAKWVHKDNYRLSCRLVRAELCPQRSAGRQPSFSSSSGNIEKRSPTIP